MSTVDDSKKQDENRPTMEQVMVLGMFGLFVVLSVAFIGTEVGFYIFGTATMAYVMGFSGLMLSLGTLGFFTVLIKQSIREVVIRVVNKDN
jgi:hypothetical protein